MDHLKYRLDVDYESGLADARGQVLLHRTSKTKKWTDKLTETLYKVKIWGDVVIGWFSWTDDISTVKRKEGDNYFDSCV